MKPATSLCFWRVGAGTRRCTASRPATATSATAQTIRTPQTAVATINLPLSHTFARRFQDTPRTADGQTAPRPVGFRPAGNHDTHRHRYRATFTVADRGHANSRGA